MMPTETEIKIDTPLEGVQVTEPEVEWTAENEVNLFYAMRGRRPVGELNVFCFPPLLTMYQHRNPKIFSDVLYCREIFRVDAKRNCQSRNMGPS